MEITHVDTCLPCYVLDHCNGDFECLVGVIVDRNTRHFQMRDSLFDELQFADKIPDHIGDNEIKEAIADCFASAHPLACFDSSLDSVDDYEMESCFAWFRVTWGESE